MDEGIFSKIRVLKAKDRRSFDFSSSEGNKNKGTEIGRATRRSCGRTATWYTATYLIDDYSAKARRGEGRKGCG